jgi:SAM-dependent methyltransferase
MMDLPGNPAYLLEEDLRNLRTINRALGAYRAVIRFLDGLCRENATCCFSLLDVGAGSGDMAVAVARWARRKGVSVNVVALEADPVTARVARRHTRGFPEISVICADALHPPFSAAAFDFVLASQLLHHFSESEIIESLRKWSVLARGGLLMSDLVRHPLAYYGIRLLTGLFTRNPMTRTDAPLSVQKAFTLAEWRTLFQRAAVGEFVLSPFFPFRVFVFFPLRM